MTDLLVLTHATERDIDLLLVEEFLSSLPFARFVLDRAGLGHLRMDTVGAMHSTRRLFNRREIDMSVTVGTDRGSVLLLIENKLDTSEQKGQAQSYRAEAEELAAKHHRVVTILVAPEAYSAQNAAFADAFDVRLPYEVVADHFAARAAAETGELAARLAHRGRVMRRRSTSSGAVTSR
ncbi:PD-(D/E)XK nuclease family protein [Falsirhodobacter xinxiangensis]|uniref:PD-(D/E)XK nuclease family protein n=1 Tax=Falsirhodobacter xinxiangensis TaxID=2530049 RepID=UPI0010AAECB9|nr:PD-(D/E)XK nuclease family protein [Rhodobacter xinxiangensis]